MIKRDPHFPLGKRGNTDNTPGLGMEHSTSESRSLLEKGNTHDTSGLGLDHLPSGPGPSSRANLRGGPIGYVG